MMVSKQGFTLIELMIVIAIIAIIASIAIPSLIRSKISANEAAAANSLKTFNSMLAAYKRKGYAGFGRIYPFAVGPETNVGKYCGLYYETNSNGEMVNLIGIAEAHADAGAAAISGPMNGLPATYVPVIKTTAGRVYQPAWIFGLADKQGYWYGLCRANNAGFSYDRAMARLHYGMFAVPNDYGSSGESTFMVSEQGTVYTLDLGVSGWQPFPGPDPVINGWEIAK